MRWGVWEWRRCERVWFSVSLAEVANQLLQKNNQKIVHTLLHNIHVHYTHTVQCSRNQHKER